MWIKIRQPSRIKGFAKNRTNGRGIAPVIPSQPCCFKLASSPKHPPCHNFTHFITYRKEEGIEGLAKFRLNFPGVLIDAVCDEIDMLSFIEAVVLSLAPVSSVNATRARFRRSISLPTG